MNTIYYNVYLSSILPWGILLLINLICLKFCYSLSFMAYIATFLIVLHPSTSYLKDQNISMVLWHKMKRVSELLLMFDLVADTSYLFLVFWGLFILCFIKLPAKVTNKIRQPSIYCTFMCLSLPSASLGSAVIIIAHCILSMPTIRFQKNKTYSPDEVNLLLHMYHGRNIAQTWLLFLQICFHTKQSSISVLVAVVTAFLFLVYIIATEGGDIIRINDIIARNIQKLPKEYPYPCDFNYAVANCDVAKRVFKDHCA